MKKRFLCAVLSLALAVGLCPAALAAEEEAPAVPKADVLVDGERMPNFRAEIYDNTAYLSLYGATLALRPDASVSWEEDRLVARAEDFVLSAKVGDIYLEINGCCLYIPGRVKFDSVGDTLVPARVLGRALGASVDWVDGDVCLTGGGTPLASPEGYYDATDLDLIARVIMHESGNQSLEGKIAVGNVILNRVNSPSFPNTVAEVLAQKNQFPGATNATPNASSLRAAQLCLDGAMLVPGAYYFNGVGRSCWASRNKSLIAIIGGHAFYG